MGVQTPRALAQMLKSQSQISVLTYVRPLSPWRLSIKSRLTLFCVSLCTCRVSFDSLFYLHWVSFVLHWVSFDSLISLV